VIGEDSSQGYFCKDYYPTSFCAPVITETKFINQNNNIFMITRNPRKRSAIVAVIIDSLENISKIFTSVMLLISGLALAVNPTFAQEKRDSTVTEEEAFRQMEENAYKQMIEYSRPGKNHQLLADLVGTWTFKGRHLSWVDSVNSTTSLEYSGTIVRKSFAHGRFFVSDVISDGMLEMPIQDGKMMEAKFQGVEIEGYDNVKKKYIKTTIGNHFGSGIPVIEGVYDPSTRAITFDFEMELAPGMKTKDHFLLIFIDNDHYKYEYFRDQNGKYRLESEINFTRVEGK
jgi:hypothetical protein